MIHTLLTTILTSALTAGIAIAIALVVHSIRRGRHRKLGAPEIVLLAEQNKLEELKDYVRGGADVNARGLDGETALMIVAYHGNAHGVQWLVQNGARIDLKDNKGRTATTIATTEECRQLLS